ncbi:MULTISPECIES: hypothetical protein [unclassified Streptomyces]|uniref:hypothetical protein n=1 Tax=unclassified Streptomyces TaxID=2593676 RepID=UPI001F03CBBB|nr:MULTISPECIES: hypothetical protein [unclassified Streptomyces]MCH0564906.1 hypothetical protein [Streptomyces sp. MUM 2J]MCH0571063.1 hypothetical protein [Streptomyces sp. MUM 136J]
MKLKHRAAWWGITAAALVATAGCSGETARDTAKKAAEVADKSTDQIMATLTRASDKTKGLGSAEIRTTTVIEATGGKPISMEGTYSWGDGAAMDVRMDTAAAQMSALQDDPTTQLKMVDGAYYYGIDPQPSGVLKGKHWMRIDVSAVAGEAGANNIANNADPTAGLRYVGASKKVKDLGEETVLGKSATHYRGTVGAEQIKDSKFTAAEKKAAIDSLNASGGQITYDIWVDHSDLPVRMEQHGAGLSVTMDFLKFGATKAITAPPASDTGDLTEQVRSRRDAALGQ